ncbi:unnamed protein product [Phytomonas sp. EM1]|nr:unnamed protein product [Phytomonas sp. EM1]|eukprot:CCW63282.1 unnamed protein product [Phytomonas sp. isolate EM1]
METHYPNDEKLLNLMKGAFSLSEELKHSMEEDIKGGFVEGEKTELVRRCFAELIRREVQKGLCVSCVKHLMGDLWVDALNARVGGAAASPTRVFADVASFLRAFPPSPSPSQPPAGVVVFSASSAGAQRAFLRHTQYGDLSAHVVDYADTATVGGKLSPRSYTKLRRHLNGWMAREGYTGELRLVFVSDNLTELSSAEASGSVDCSLLCVRPFSKWMNLETLTVVGIPHICSLEQLLDPEAPVDHVAIVEDATKLIV